MEVHEKDITSELLTHFRVRLIYLGCLLQGDFSKYMSRIAGLRGDPALSFPRGCLSYEFIVVLGSSLRRAGPISQQILKISHLDLAESRF